MKTTRVQYRNGVFETEDGVPFEDQEAIYKLTYKLTHIRRVATLDQWMKIGLNEGFYTIPEIEVKIDLLLSDDMTQVARILPPAKEQVESQDELWKEARHLIDTWNIDKLFNEFTITRKPS